MTFTPASLLAQLMRFPIPHRYCVAFSGGLDSHVLLHALAQLREQLPCPDLHAIHINHGIHPDADQWTRHCEIVCRDLGVTFESHCVQVQKHPGQSLEASAREARYVALAACSHRDDMLLLAHHQDDQAETLLLQLLRGSGVKGLAAMPAIKWFADGWLGRPLLGVTRESLHDYAVFRQLPWIEDPSNADTTFERNFLRHVVLPFLRQRLPAVDATLVRVAQHQAEAAELLDALAQQDIQDLMVPDSISLRISALQQLASTRQRNVLRYWLHHVCALPLPTTAQLQRILEELLTAAEDAMPLVHWPGAEVRRFRDRIHAMTPLHSVDPTWESKWDLQTALELPTGEVLRVIPAEGAGLSRQACTAGVTVRYRQGGERCRLVGRSHHHTLKKLLQDWDVPPWQRDRIPLIYIGDQLAQITGYCVCAPFITKPQEVGLQIIVDARTPAIETMRENKDNSPGCTP